MGTEVPRGLSPYMVQYAAALSAGTKKSGILLADRHIPQACPFCPLNRDILYRTHVCKGTHTPTTGMRLVLLMVTLIPLDFFYDVHLSLHSLPGLSTREKESPRASLEADFTARDVAEMQARGQGSCLPLVLEVPADKLPTSFPVPSSFFFI